LKILFVGTPDFAVVSLDSIVKAGHEIVGVITAPDKPKGRGMKLAMSEVKEYSLEKNIPIFQPEKIRNNPDFIEEIRNLHADIGVVVVYGKILPKEFLDLFEYGCINVHPSLLPKYRGAAPIQWAIINGDQKTGVCTMYLDVGMDDGDVILKNETPIGENETAGELWDRLSKMGAEMLVETLDNISHGIIKRFPQEGEVVLAPKIDKELSKIDWNKQTASEIKNLVRGLTPGLGAYSNIENKKIKFWKVDCLSNDDFKTKFEINNLEAFSNGTVLVSSDKIGLYIKTKSGIISVLEIQGENSKKMNINEFLRGTKIGVGNIFC
jgi:methionyl-tRNA formyltransferase